MNDKRILEIALRQSAYDCNCEPMDFLKNENSVHESVMSEKARRYLKLPLVCDLVSYGTNIVASGRAELLSDIKRFIDGCPNIENCFETPGLYALNGMLERADARICFMAEYFLPSMDGIYRFDQDCGYETRILEPNEFEGLYKPEWKNALCAERKQLDILAVGAYDKGELVGMAGCSADCDTMWQIGIDVLPEYRRLGIASALTNRLAREALERERVPFYCAAWSNIKSVKNALRSGFRPGWVEATAKSNDFIENMMKKN